MKDPRVTRSLGIEHPILQAGMPWVSNPELAAAVSNAGGLGILHPSAGMDIDGNLLTNLRENMRRLRRLTNHPFGVCFYLANPLTAELMEAAIEEGMKHCSHLQRESSTFHRNVEEQPGERHSRRFDCAPRSRRRCSGRGHHDSRGVLKAEGCEAQTSSPIRCWSHKSSTPSPCLL